MENKYLEDLKEIKDIMNRSSRFVSLSGLSGISAGLIALAGAYYAHKALFSQYNFSRYDAVALSQESVQTILIIAFSTIALAIISVLLLTRYETQKRNEKSWNILTKRILINLFIPLMAGGIICLILLFNGYVSMIPPITLIFYGLALYNASKYTLNEMESLGLIELTLGVLGFYFIEYGLIFWTVGFGVVHIVYGTYMHFKYKS
jgi:hypothetical protein